MVSTTSLLCRESVPSRASTNFPGGKKFQHGSIRRACLLNAPTNFHHPRHRAAGDRVWEYGLYTKPWAGVLSTAGKLVLGGSDEGYFFALDAETGKEVWRQNTGGIIRASPITYLSRDKQVVAVAAGNAIFAFELGE